MEENGRIYLDYNATTPIDPAVAEAMKPFLYGFFGNPSSSHWFGSESKKAIESARSHVAALLNCSSGEVIFTSGGTESNNLAIKGAAFSLRHKGNHIISSQIEHPAVVEVCHYLQTQGFSITWLPVDEFGLVHPEELEKAITPQTILISIMHANNEVGTLQPIKELSDIAHSHGILFHTDAAQTIGKVDVDVKKLGVDLLSIAGHKFYAPKGVGALYIRSGLKLEKLLHGADHEQNIRAGTENVLEIAGLGKACQLAKVHLVEHSRHMQEMRDNLYAAIREWLPEVRLNGHPELRLPNTLSLSFPGIEANLLLSALEVKGIAASAGAACHSESVSISPVLTAMMIPMNLAMGTLRFSTGRFTTTAQVEKAAELISESVRELRPEESIVSDVAGDFRDYPLTQFTQGLGCACKMKPQVLQKILAGLPIPVDPSILVGSSTSDDAAVVKLSDEQAVVLTVDFFTPIVDDPFSFGAIAAANALSDIYAMGARPLFALNIVGFPSGRLPHSILGEILKGAQSIAEEAGIPILGGHTIDDPEPKFGMCVLGLVHPEKVLRNRGAKPGDLIILTKPLGTGVLCTAMKRKLTDRETEKEVIDTMSILNRRAAEIISKYPVSACTDVTGFGLSGHLQEMIASSELNALLDSRTIPLLSKATDYTAAGIVPGGTKNNLEFAEEFTVWGEQVPDVIRTLICDAQTSGGLLFTVEEKAGKELITKLRQEGYPQAAIVGVMQAGGSGKIKVD